MWSDSRFIGVISGDISTQIVDLFLNYSYHFSQALHRSMGPSVQTNN